MVKCNVLLFVEIRNNKVPLNLETIQSLTDLLGRLLSQLGKVSTGFMCLILNVLTLAEVIQKAGVNH